MVMRPAARINDAKVERLVRAGVSLFFQVVMLIVVVRFAHYGQWNWAWLWLGIFAVGYLSDIREAIRKL
jgi:hypothetical protein